MRQEGNWPLLSGDRLFDAILLLISGIAFTLMMALVLAGYAS